jgi:hypothetical protein
MRCRIVMVSATLTVLTVAAGLTAANVSAATAQTSQANSALRYLYGQQGADGSVASSLGATEDIVISVADAGYDPATLVKGGSSTGAYSYMSAHASGVNTAGGAAKYVLAWVAAGKPSALASSAQSLLTRLNTPTSSGGYLGANGAFHNSDATVETANAYSQALSVLADIAGNVTLPAHATDWLLCAQLPDGGFGYVITDAASTPPAFCGDKSSDTNDTGIILQALGQAGVSSANSAAVGYLHSAQQADGGFSFSSTGSSDPDSDEVVVQALLAIGQDPTGASWTVSSGKNPIANMESFADPKGSGGYVFPGNTTPDAFTTVQIPQALELKPYAASTSIAAGTSPNNTTSASASASATASASDSAGVVPVPATGAAIGNGGTVPGALLLVVLGGLASAVAVMRRRRGETP